MPQTVKYEVEYEKEREKRKKSAFTQQYSQIQDFAKHCVCQVDSLLFSIAFFLYFLPTKSMHALKKKRSEIMCMC